MKKGKIIYILWLSVLAVLLSFPAAALDVPVLKHRVNDLAGMLGPGEEASLENLLIDTENKTSSQVVVLTIPSLEGEALEDFSLRVAEKNRIGQDEYDNGALLLVARSEKKIRIEVGYGLEHIITDAKSDYIIRKLIASQFKRRRFFAGINDGLKAVTGLITKEFDISPEELAKFRKERKKTKGRHLPMGVIVFFIFIALSIFKGSSRRGYGSGASAVFWGSMLGGGSHHRGGGGGFFGGGGGFSGGGGSFGGGGSSGGW